MQTTGIEKTSDYDEELVSRDDISEHSSSKALSPGISETAPGAQNDRFDLENTLENLHECSWEVLQEKFSTAMETHAQAEQELRDQTAKLLEVFMTWSQVAVSYDEDRAFKRFKTRMQHVQNSETKLEDKKKHYANVVKAFESALALLEG
ncbi:hypothetical protein DTO212C5_1458 [Paecilomyces variotii]|nr:hypothetical protein DTO212C5_1458 [Paecilomyces variotii]